jgi:hypothetical protein
VNREAFEHVIRAAATIVDDDLVVVGSQAVLAQFRDPPAPLIRSMEVHLYPRSAPERAAEIDANLGDGSQFHATNDYYGHGVGPETVYAPAGWESRLVRVDVVAVTRKPGKMATAWCMEIHDLVLAKLAAGREHDIEYARGAIAGELVDTQRLVALVEEMPMSHREHARRWVTALVDATTGGEAP